MSAHKEWQAHGLKIWETGSDGLERVIAEFNQDKYKACKLAAAAPALLEALEMASQYVDQRLTYQHDQIRAALAKSR